MNDLVKILMPIGLFLFTLPGFSSQPGEKENIECVITSERITLDGRLTEPVWNTARQIQSLTMVEPETGIQASEKTVISILADENKLYLGVHCYVSNPEDIVAYTKARDAELRHEDYVKFVLDTYLDGRNGFIFAINPFGARYDALVSRYGESENVNWDAVWEAKTRMVEDGWTAEIIIPVKTLTFGRGLKEWGFNVERRMQRKMEVDRWTGISKDIRVGHVAIAGLLSGLPEFNMGIGLTIRGSTNANISRNRSEKANFKWHNSLDITEKFTPEVTGQLTINTDFAETEVDSRRTNLTRFPLFYPEKREFFLQGADIYDFGLGLGRDFAPFFSRRIGLYDGREVPLLVGGKLNGKIKNTNFGALVTRMGALDTTLSQTTLGVARVKQNIGKHINVGLLTTVGDPASRSNSFTSGFDMTYQTSSFGKGQNFLVGIWGLINNREDISGDKSAYGISLDYPNDKWDIYSGYKRIGDAFDPSLGFVPRKGVNMYRLGCDFMPRPKINFIRQFYFENSFSLVTNLQNQWESYRLFMAPFHFRLESGDRFEFNFIPTGENLFEPFEVSDGVEIPAGSYHWIKYRLELELASKRKINGQLTWWFGGFYTGRLDQIEMQINLRPSSFLNFEVSYEKDIGHLTEGDFVKNLLATRVLFNFTPDMQLSSFIQYDSDSKNLGTNTRFRWTFNPKGDLYFVYNHNITNEFDNRWLYQANQLIVKLTYALWM